MNPVSTKDLVEKCRRFVLADPASEAIDLMIRDALIRAELQIRRVDTVPLAWLRGEYTSNTFRSRVYGAVSDVTDADPGVFDVDSLDTNVTGHGFSDDDIVYVTGFAADSLDELNYRFYRVNYVNSTTFTLNTLDDADAIATDTLDAYDSGGTFFHAGIKIPTSSIEPSSSSYDADYLWTIGDIFAVTFDGSPLLPITEDEVQQNSGFWCQETSAVPSRFRYWRHDLPSFAAGSREHFLLWYPPCANSHTIRIWYEKSYPQMQTWVYATGANTIYPPHPPEIHDMIWVRALSILATEFEKQRRQSKEGRIDTRVEVINAQHWLSQAAADEAMIRTISRSVLGSRVGRLGLKG